MMKVRRKIRHAMAAIPTGLYVHSSPPTVVQPHPSVIRQWLRGGEVDKLEDVILNGQGHKLLGEYSSDLKVRAFLKTVPAYLARIDMIHDAVSKGNLIDLRTLLQPTSASGVPRKKIPSLALCRDQSGNGILHKAVFYGYTEMVEWVVHNFPQTIDMRDREKRTPLHYCGRSEDVGHVWTLLTEAGAESNLVDKQGHTPTYYIDHPEELRLPSTPINMPAGRFTSGKNGIVIKQSNIRIWIHDQDLGRLQQVVWEGHGAKLRTETSHQPLVRKFLNAIPYIMGTIKDAHSAVVKNDLILLKRKTEDPVPKQIFSSKDANGLTPLHKAAGLGHTDIVQYILDRYPKAISIKDNGGRTPLHYSVILKDKGDLFNLLKEYGADDTITDKKGKTASFYLHKHHDIDSKLLTVIPEAPRTASIAPASWDWRLLNLDMGDTEELTKPPPSNGDSAFEDMAPDESPQPLLNSDEGLEQETTDDYPNQNYDIYQQDLDEGVGYEPEEFQDLQENNEPPEMEDFPTEAKDFPPEAEDLPPQVEDPLQQEDDNTDEMPKSPLYEEVETPSNKNEAIQPEEENTNIENAENEENLSPSSNSPITTDEVIREKIQTGSMEQLAEMVLLGEGESLLNYQSENPDVQLFLSNVPTYMAKIDAIHAATRQGDLRALQYTLDRRKFAVARENRSPLRLTPLHVAALYNRTSVLRFLAGRFPETMYARELKGRTPLHYAATLRDNAHFYNLLITLGADKNFQDENGKTAEYYLHNPDYVTHDQLLAEFEGHAGGEPSAAEELSDREVQQQDDSVIIRESFPVFNQEDGQYLASALGEPLIKGLTEVANARPSDPVMYLANYLITFANTPKEPQEQKMLMATEKERGDYDDDEQAYEEPPEPQPEFQEPNEPPPPPTSAFKPTSRDEFGQTILHFAMSRSHGRNAVFQLLQELDTSVAFRDELYRTARDIAIQVNIAENIQAIDKFVVFMAANGEIEKLQELMLEGYDHILDTSDEEKTIQEVASERGQATVVNFLQTVSNFEDRREKLHRVIRLGSDVQVKEMLATGQGTMLAVAKNAQSRCSLHIAILNQQKEIAEHIAHSFPQTINIGDNLLRMPLHYAMATDEVESLSQMLIKAGAVRVVKDLKGRQPSYYFMNKSEIQKLQDEEEVLRI